MLFKSRKKLLPFLITSSLFFSINTFAATEISLFNPNENLSTVPMDKITQLVRSHFNVDQYRNIKVQIIYNAKHVPDHLLVYLFSKKYHSVQVAKIDIDARYQGLAVNNNYRLTSEDFAAQPGITVTQAQCPDPSVEFIAFAPNDDSLEQSKTVEVANAAIAHGLKTVQLLKSQATRTNYLNYMKCPNLKGNFYDGDANPDLITTVDGTISYTDINTTLLNQFNYKVTNIWLACEAYNDPMKTSVITTAESQKYAAGINDLEVGPSDNTGACAMEAALNNQAMTAAFQACYKQYDNSKDHWGFGGNGSDYFGA